MRIVLDSNIAIAALNRVPAVVERLATIRADDITIPMAAIDAGTPVGELARAALGGRSRNS